MRAVSYLFFLFLPLLFPMELFGSRYLENRIPSTDKRFSTFDYCLTLLAERGAKILVETGTSRAGASNCCGDGCSTVIFGQWAYENGANFTSIDIDPAAIRAARRATSALNPDIHFVVQDSISFFKKSSEQIDFLYLDSYDFDCNNPTPSQLHHLKEIQAAYPLLHRDTVIMIDDCGLPHGGKGKLAIDFLLVRGWQVVLSQYQTILVYPG